MWDRFGAKSASLLVIGLVLSAGACSEEPFEVTSIEPSLGTARGGQKVRIRGKGLDGNLQVTFGSAAAQQVRPVSTEAIEVVTPRVTAGLVDVTVSRQEEVRTLTAGFEFLPLELQFVTAPSRFLQVREGLELADGASADFDGDGDPDVLLAQRHGPPVLLLNQGNGMFASEQQADAGAPPGDDDLEAGVPDADAGALDAEVPEPDGGVPQEDAAAGDDASIEAGVPDEDASVEAGPEGQAPEPEPEAPMTFHARKVLVEDFDGDGTPDAFFCNAGRQEHGLLLNDGNGELELAPPGTVTPALDECVSAASADMDGDGRADVVVLGRGPSGGGESYVRVYANGKQGKLTPVAHLERVDDQAAGRPCGTVTVSSSEIVASFEIDQTVAMAGRAAGRAQFDLGTGQGVATFALEVPELDEPPIAMQFGIRGGGAQVLKATVVDASGEVYTAELGQLAWTTFTQIRTEPVASWTHTGGDGNGLLDLPLSRIEWEVHGTGVGIFHLDDVKLELPGQELVLVDDFERTRYAAAWRDASSVAAGDLDGDGRPDLAVGLRREGRPNLVVLFNREGEEGLRLVEAAAGKVPDVTEPVSAVALVDADRDGDADVVVVTDGQDRLLINDGQGHFFDDTARMMPLDGAMGRSVSCGDFDLDGKADLAIANAGIARLYVNRGQGGLLDVSPSLPMEAQDALVLLPLDAEGDGDLDLFTIHHGAVPKLYVSVESEVAQEPEGWR